MLVDATMGCFQSGDNTYVILQWYRTETSYYRLQIKVNSPIVMSLYFFPSRSDYELLATWSPSA